MKIIRYIFYLLFILAPTVFSYPLIQITNQDISNFPEIKAFYFDYLSDGQLNSNNNTSEFKLFDNGSQRTIKKIVSKNQSPLNTSSLVIAFDLGIDTSAGQFNVGKYFISELINLYPVINSEIAITSFEAMSYLEQEFTNDKAKLISTLDNFISYSSTSIDAGLIYDLTGAIPIAEHGKYSKNALVLTDGTGNFDAQTIIKTSKFNNVRLFIINLNAITNDSLKLLSDSTGGKYFDINDSNDVKGKAAAILSYIYNFLPCEIYWDANPDCKELHNIALINNSTKDTCSYPILVSESIQPYIAANPPFLKFSAVLPGLTKTLDLQLIAKNGFIKIDSISINNPVFTIESGNITQPVVLNKGDIHTIKVKYTPLDSALEFGSLNIVTDACSGKNVLITGGFPNAQPKSATLKIIEPLPHQVFIVGDSANVEWTGLLPADVVQLEYSINNGRNWDTLAKNASGLKYSWIVPDKPSDSCLIRVIQLWPNNIGRTLDLKHKNGVNSANFNSDGSLIITACKDSIAKIWNANNGVKLFDLKGHTKPLLWGTFDKQEKYAVTSSEDKTAILWNASNGDSIRTFSAHTNSVRSANFSPDGKNIVTSGMDGSCFIWDVGTAKITDTLSYNGIQLWFANYSPDGNYIAVADNIGRCNIWNVNTKKFEKVFNTKTNGVVSNLSFSPDGKKLVAATWLGRAFIWNFETGDTLFTVVHYDSVQNIVPLTSANFNYTGQLLLTSGTNEARMWNGNTGEFIAPPYSEHRNGVQSAVFNFDGTRVLTASWDSTAKIWNLLERALQTGVTDSVFSISRSVIKSDDITFDPVAINSIKDTALTKFVTNTSNFPISITSLKISGPNASEFNIIRGITPIRLDTGKSANVSIRFIPKDIGKRTALIEIKYSGNNKITKTLTGYGYDPGLQVVTPNIDFRTVEIGDLKDTTINVVVRNRSDSVIKIKSVRNSGPDNVHFILLNGADTVSLNPGESRSMSIRFIPEITGRKNDILYIDHSAKGSPSRISLFGEGINPRIDTITFSMSDIEANPGEQVDLSLFVKSLSNKGLNNGISGFRATLSFNSTLLEPSDSFVEDKIRAGERSISFDLPRTDSSNSVLKVIKFKVGLGNDTISKLDLKEILPIGKGRIVINKESSIFRLKGYCKEGGNRLFESENKLQMTLVAPNPMIESSVLNFEVIENGLHRVKLIDINGAVIKTIFERTLEAGQYQIEFNTSDISSGRYFLMLETPTKNLLRQIEIAK